MLLGKRFQHADQTTPTWRLVHAMATQNVIDHHMTWARSFGHSSDAHNLGRPRSTSLPKGIKAPASPQVAPCMVNEWHQKVIFVPWSSHPPKPHRPRPSTVHP